MNLKYVEIGIVQHFLIKMNNFTKKNISIDQGSISSYIKKIREKKGISISEASLKTGINIKYLEAIEDSNYEILPKGSYAKIFFKRYISFLEIKHKNMVADFLLELNRNQRIEKNIFFNKIVSWKSFISLPKLLRNVLIFLLVLVCFFYLYFYLKNVFSAPYLEVYNLQEEQVVNENKILIEGKTDIESDVFVNGQNMIIDKEGYFSQEVYLKKGLNFITISSKKKYSKENIIIRQILVEK